MGRKGRAGFGPKLVEESPEEPIVNEHAMLAEQRSWVHESRTPEERAAALDRICKKVKLDNGKPMTTLRGIHGVKEEVRGVIRTGSIGLDICLGVGGLPRGRVVEFYGAEASGKTTLALHCIHEVQKAGGIAAFIDAEHALDVNYAEHLGINTNDLIFMQPDNGEQALQTADNLIESGEVDLIVIDSVAALVPKSELEGNIGDSHPGAQARLMSQTLRKLTGRITRTNTTVIFINQVREKIGVMFGSPKTTSGGNALKFYASVRIEVIKIGAIKVNDKQEGNRVKLSVVKNKVSPPFRSAEVDLIFGEGISKYGELIDYGTTFKIIEKKGSWYAYGEENLGQGKDNSIIKLKENPQLLEEITAKVNTELARSLR